jgi:hypothetical protein
MSFLDGFFASDPGDPRYGANMQLFGSMMAGNLPQGVAAYGDAMQKAKAQALQARVAELQLRKGTLEITDMERKLADDQAARDVLQQFARDRATPAATAIGAAPAMRAPGAIGSGSYGITPEPPQGSPAMTASTSAPVSAPAAPQAAARNNIWQLYQRMGDALSDKGLAVQAQNYYGLAEKFRPKYGTEPRVMIDPATGKLAQVLVAEDGSTQVLPFGVKPNIKMQDLGGRVAALDENTLQNGQVFDKTQSPDSVASVNATLRGQNMTDARSRDTIANGRVPAGYRLSTDGTSLEFIPGGPADPNAAKRAAPTEFQGKAMMFGARAQAADKVLSQLTGSYSPSAINVKAGVGNTPLIGGVLEPMANMTLSANSQRAEQAQRDFVNAVLRLESGAAISQSEFDNARKQYFPQPGDGPAVITQKAQNRQMAIRGLLANARPGSVEGMGDNTGGAGGSWSIQRVN